MLEHSDYANVYQVVLRAVPAARQLAVKGRSLLERPAPPLSKLRYVAFYLPQFHPIPENDAWSDRHLSSTNVTKALPPSHEQPATLADRTRLLRPAHTGGAAPADRALAREHGIDAFCFHYYWFGDGRRLLERPILDFLADVKSDIDYLSGPTKTGPANGTHPRTKGGAQTYSPENDITYHRRSAPALPRPAGTLRVNGALAVGRLSAAGDARRTRDGGALAPPLP